MIPLELAPFADEDREMQLEALKKKEESGLLSLDFYVKSAVWSFSDWFILATNKKWINSGLFLCSVPLYLIWFTAEVSAALVRIKVDLIHLLTACHRMSVCYWWYNTAQTHTRTHTDLLHKLLCSNCPPWVKLSVWGWHGASGWKTVDAGQSEDAR